MELSAGMFGSRHGGNLFFLDSLTSPVQSFRLHKVCCTELFWVLLVLLLPVECSFPQEANLSVCEPIVTPADPQSLGKASSSEI